MKANYKVKFLLGTFFTLVATIYLVSCAGQQKKESPVAMVVTSVSGDAKVVKADSGKEFPGKIGLIVNEHDKVLTTNGSMDLQTRSGSVVRVREFSTVTIAELAGATTKVEMESGSILANVKKASARDEFNVVTPTAVAGVRGTTFSVDVENGKRPRVKVIDGKVAMAPRIPALEKLSQDQIDSNKTLKALQEIQQKEVVLENETEGTLDENLENQVAQVNAVLEQAIEEKATEPSSMEGMEAVDVTAEKVSTINMEKLEAAGGLQKAEELTKAVEANKEAFVGVEKAEITQQEIVDQQTLLAVDDKVIEKVIANSNNAGAEATDVQSAVDEIKAERQKKEEIVLEKIEKEASKKEINSEEEIKKFYNKLELITLKNGEKISGAIIAQTGNTMVIHSAEGVRRVKKTEILSQEFLY